MPVTAAAAQNLLSTFTDLQRSVQTTVQVHAGNEVKLDIKRGHVLRFLAVLNQVRVVHTLCWLHSLLTFTPFGV
jgi:hypothetical protein